MEPESAKGSMAHEALVSGVWRPCRVITTPVAYPIRGRRRWVVRVQGIAPRGGVAIPRDGILMERRIGQVRIAMHSPDRVVREFERSVEFPGDPEVSA